MERNGLHREDREVSRRPTEAQVRSHRFARLPTRSWRRETVLLDVRNIDFTHHEVWRRMGIYSVHFVCSFPRHEMGGACHVVFVGWICDRIMRGLNQNLTHGDVVLMIQHQPSRHCWMKCVVLEVERELLLVSSPRVMNVRTGWQRQAISRLKEMTRAHKMAMKTVLGTRLSVKHFAFPWLVDHCTDVLDKAVVGADGCREGK